MCGEEFSIGGGVRERNLIFAQVRTINKVVPVGKFKKAQINDGKFIFGRCIIKLLQVAFALTGGTRACAWRCPGASSCWQPRCGWYHIWRVPVWWSSTKLSDAQTSPSHPLNPPARAPRSPCTPVNTTERFKAVRHIWHTTPWGRLSPLVRALWLDIQPLSCHWRWRGRFWSGRDTWSPPAGSPGHCPPSPWSPQPEEQTSCCLEKKRVQMHHPCNVH